LVFLVFGSGLLGFDVTFESITFFFFYNVVVVSRHWSASSIREKRNIREIEKLRRAHLFYRWNDRTQQILKSVSFFD